MAGPSFDPADRPPAVAAWEWRAVAARFDLPPGLLDGAPAEARTDTVVLAPGLGPGRLLALRGGRRLEVRTLLEALPPGAPDGPAERWATVCAEDLPALPHVGRVVARLLAPGAPVPVRPLPDPAAVVDFVRALRVGAPRCVTVAATRAVRDLDGGVRLERARLTLEGGRALEALALAGPSPAALAAARARLALPPDAVVASEAAWLAALPAAGA